MLQLVALLFWDGWGNACVDGNFVSIWVGEFCAVWSDFPATMLQWVALLFCGAGREEGAS
jgi:hypothetical protein